MNTSFKKITSSRTFWITAGLVILFLLLRKYLFWGDIRWGLDITPYLVFNGPYVSPLIIPMIFFYLLVKRRKIYYFMSAIIFFILWFFWSAYVLAWSMQQFGGGFIIIEKDRMNLLTILIFSVVSTMYIFQCNYLLPKKDTLSSGKRIILWLSWFVGLLIIASSAWMSYHAWAWSDIKAHSASLTVHDYSWVSRNCIFNSVDYLFMWLLFSLPATLKIDDILSKGK